MDFERIGRTTAVISILAILQSFHLVEALAAAGQILNQTSISGEVAVEQIRRETRPRLESRMGNSVDTGTGAFILDMPLVSVEGGRSLDFKLHYNSLLTGVRGRVGYGWSHDFEAFLEQEPGGLVTVHWDRNRRNSFRFRDSSSEYEPLDEAVLYDRLFRQTDDDWRLIRKDGTVYEFSPDGELKRIGNKVLQYLEPGYFRGEMYKVEEPISDKRLDFFYSFDGLIETIQDSSDFREKRIYHLSYNSDQLIDAIYKPVTLGDEYGTCCPSIDVPDNDPAGLLFDVTVTEGGPIGLTQISAGSVEHPRPQDLRIFLTSPQGTEVLLFDRVPADSGTVSFSGKVVDEFRGEDPFGIWQVRVVDTAPGSEGQFRGWALRFSGPTRSTHFEYEDRQITRATAGDGTQLFTNEYDGAGRVIAQDDGVSSNLVAIFSYEDLPDGGIRTHYQNRVGDSTILEHDSKYRLRRVTDALGNSSTWEYDSSGNRIRATDALGRTTHFTYDERGELISVVDPAGFESTFEYLSDGNLIRIRDALGKETRFSYDPNNNLTRIRDALGNEDNKSYDGNSRLTSNLLAGRGGINIGYSGGRPTVANHPAESGSVGMEYDTHGRLVSTTDMEGFTRTIEYSPTDQVIAQTDPLGNRIVSEYDARDRLVRKVDARGNESRFAYDGNNNIVAVTDALGQVTRYEYDGEDRLVRTIDPQGNVSTVTYDALGRVIAETDPLGRRLTHEYDAVGNQIATYDQDEVAVRKVRYDSRDFPVESQDAFGHKTLLEYDGLGRLTAVIDPLGRRTQYDYDALDRPVSVRDPLNRVAAKEYWPDDFVRYLVNPRGFRTEFSYDLARRLQDIDFQQGDLTRFEHNKRDLLTEVRKPSGVTYRYSYDGAGRLERFSTSGPGLIVPEIFYQYDPNGNLTEVSTKSFSDIDPVPQLSRTYDVLDRLISYTDSRGNRIGYAYDESGNLSRLTYPDGSQVRYAYDGANRLVRITDWADRTTRYFWDSKNRLSQVEFPNGTVREMEYDRNGQVLLRKDMDSQGRLIVGYRYSYDAAGQINAEIIEGSDREPYQPQPVSMTYDSLNRLETYNGRATTFDRNGNMLFGPLGDDFEDFRYDHKNNLVSAGDVSYFYNPDDQLTGFRSGGENTDLVISPSGDLAQVIQKTTAREVTRYVYGIGLAYEVSGSEVRVHHYDHRGSTTALSSGSGVVVGTVQYGPFGEVVRRSGDSDSLFLFSGFYGVVTDPNGLSYMRFRWYSPQIKRFVNADAHFGDIALPHSLNRYAYTGNNPVSRVDPGGEFWNLIGGAIVGGAVSTIVKVASDAISGKKVDFTSGDYWAEIGGAFVAGAATGACLSSGVGVAAGALCGAAGGSLGYLTASGLKGDQVDAEQLAFEAGVGAAGGALGAGASRFLRFGPKRAVGNRFAQFRHGFRAKSPTDFKLGLLARDKAIMASDEYLVTNILPKAGVRKLIGTSVGKDVARALARRAFTPGFVAMASGSLGVRVGGRLVGNALFNSQGGGGAGASATSPQIEQSGWEGVSAGNKGAYGEFIHWQLYIDALRLAGRPIPSNPNNVLATF